METPIMVAMISAVVTLVSAILGSPLFVNMVNKIGAPVYTSTAEFVVSQGSLFPTNPPGGELFTPTFTPVGSGTEIIASTSTPPGENHTPTAPLLEPTFTATSLPPEEPDTPTPAADSIFRCIAADMWDSYPSSNPGVSDGCLNFTGWGFSTDQGRLLLVHVPAQDQQRGIYTPIAGDVEIHFSLQLNEFRTRFNKAGFLNFGVVQNDPISIFKGGYLSYQQPLPGPDSPVRVLVSGSNQATQKISALETGFQQDVLFSIQADLMTVYLNGKQAGDPVSLPRTKRAFWIGYVLPAKSELDVLVTNFSIQAR